MLGAGNLLARGSIGTMPSTLDPLDFLLDLLGAIELVVGAAEGTVAFDVAHEPRVAGIGKLTPENARRAYAANLSK